MINVICVVDGYENIEKDKMHWASNIAFSQNDYRDYFFITDIETIKW